MGFVAMLHVIKPGELRTERLLIVSSRCKVSDCHVTLSAYGESAAKARVQEWIIAGPGLKPGTRHSRSQTWLCPKRTTQSISPAEADSRRVTCGVAEVGKTVTLMYTVPDPADRITWEFIPQQNEDGTASQVIQMIALDSKRGHRSKPVPDHKYKKLGSPKKTRENIYYMVKMSRKDNISIEEYFNN